MTQENQQDGSEGCAAYLKALADPTRLRVVETLRSGTKSVSAIAKTVGAEMAIVSHHLRVLFHAGIVVTKREGKFIYYSLNSKLTGKLAETNSLDFGCCKLEMQEAPEERPDA